VASALDVDPGLGLSVAEAQRRLAAHGPNELAARAPRPRWLRFADQFRNGMAAILAVTAVVAGLIGDLKDTFIILAVLVLNAVLGYVQEQRAEAGLAALASMTSHRARVRRDGVVVEVPAAEVVVGDVLLMESGDRVAADGRLVVTHRAEVDESTLTGESAPVAKHTDELPSHAPLGDRANSVFRSTALTRGRAEALVVATGAATELGKVAALLERPPERTPLQVQLDRLGKRLALIALVSVAGYGALSLVRGHSLGETAIESVALAVAAIPEGLPAVVTVALAIATSQMAKHGAIVRRLASVETLGATTVICSDKTGTLTLNEMTAGVVELTDGRRWRVTGQGYGTAGELVPDGPHEVQGDRHQHDGSLDRLLRDLALCSDARVDDGVLVGDPTEGALVVLAAKGGVDVDDARRQRPRLGEVPFDPAVKLMVTAHDGSDGRRAVVKGAPDVLLGRCRIGDQEAGRIATATARLAHEGLRVIAVAEVALGAGVDLADADALLAATRDAELLGLVGLADPPRPEALDAIAACHGAGISFTMITGDHPDTARAIAAQVGIDVASDRAVVTGHELDALGDDELTARLTGVGVVARVSPEHKVRVVGALRRRGDVVAMTGDGVNDAPALRAADIGVAMGVTGTAVAKDAADLVLTDDHIGAVVEAVRRGRALYRNIVTFVRFQLSTNIAALLTIVGAELLRLPVPFTAAQLLWVNLVMDGPPALALAADPPTGDELRRPPRDPGEQILSSRRLVPLVGVALVMAAGTLGVLAATHSGSSAEPNGRAATLAFTTFVLFQVANALVARGHGRSILVAATFRNGKLWLALGAVVALQVLAVQSPVGHALFDTTGLSWADWLVATVTALSLVAFAEVVAAGRNGLPDRGRADRGPTTTRTSVEAPPGRPAGCEPREIGRR
jgi:Ca2+-transporting ATPase